ncbi:PREDICTED: uncharacterized protein LOC104767580 isoform X2 [Camelina sativa]|uniref:Uncharacterized protein LOC104767580 isoform X2 n=1 Tax=Camelina sativa TaxID=90675 RepID=A0ABM1RCG4_CAMSA|nr:PREDICTED: uncharacterized protein LOC104767580 isoform X2 [Camelina sativa]
MEDGDLSSDSDVKKKLSSAIVVDSRVPTQAEKDQKFLRGTAKWLITTSRLSPDSFVRHIGPFLPFDVYQLEKEVLKIRKERKEMVKKFLKEFDGKLTISYDLLAYDDEYHSYSEDGSIWHKDFVCMSVHFVDRKCKVGKWILGSYPTEYARGETVSVYRIKTVLVDYEIENKVSALLVPNYDDPGHKEFDSFKKWIGKRGKIPIDPCFFRIYCCADLFRLMAGDVFDNMDLLLEEIRVLVGWGKLTPTNWNVSLRNLQEALDMEDKRVFVEDGYYQEYD